MKKLFLSLGLALGTIFSTNATTLVIENNCVTDVCIYMIQTNTVNGVSYVFIPDPTDLCGIYVPANGGSYYITDGDATNFQFPFLNEPPLSGNVLEGPGQTANLPVASLPLPPIDDWNSPDRYRFEYMKFTVKGASGAGIGFNNPPYSDNLPPETFDYDIFPGEQYSVQYVSFFGNYYFLFDDTL